MVSKWQMSGSLLGECNCDWGCPCSFDAPPTNGGCRGVYTRVIDKGAFGDVEVAGPWVALPWKFPRAVPPRPRTPPVFLDRPSDPPPRQSPPAPRQGGAGGAVRP